MRSEIETILASKGYCYFELPLSARLLLVTDGTVTELLEGLVKEPVSLGYKNQSVSGTNNFPEIEYDGNNQSCLYRQITLQGEHTRQDWLYAESIVLHEMFNHKAQIMLKHENTPIGVILNEQSSDNHRKIIDCGYAKNPTAAKHLRIDADHSFLYRKYNVMIDINPIILITEWFPIERISAVM